MTRDEAKQIIAGLYVVNVDGDDEYCEQRNTALDMAIEALSAEAVHKPDYSYEADMVKRLRAVQEAQATQGWIPCSERLPEDLEAVNVTWVNHNPPVYYQYTKDVPNADTAVYYRGVWYWWDSTICDVLGEYGEKCGAEQIDKDIEILAWMPLPKPYREDGEV